MIDQYKDEIMDGMVEQDKANYLQVIGGKLDPKMIEDTLQNLKENFKGLPTSISNQQNQFKYNEDENLKEISDYIAKTYNQHYASGVQSIQAFDAIIEMDKEESWRFFRGCALKYLWRLGRKNGFNRLDLLKAAHYLVLVMFLTKDKE